MSRNLKPTKCEKCDRWTLLGSNHVCGPQWEVGQYSGEGTTIFASTAEAAAQEYVEFCDDDYDIADGGEMRVFVTNVETGETAQYTVYGEIETAYTYTAKKLEG